MSGEIYRAKMKVGHYFGWHYMRVVGPLQPSSGHDYQRLCDWCGLRHVFAEHPLSSTVRLEYKGKKWISIGNWFKCMRRRSR